MAHTRTWSGVRPWCRTPCLCTWARGFRMAFPCWTRVASEGPRFPLAMPLLLPHACCLSPHQHQHQYFYRDPETYEKLVSDTSLRVCTCAITRFMLLNMSGSGLFISRTAVSFIASTYALPTSQQQTLSITTTA